jgi:hypothetical protein
VLLSFELTTDVNRLWTTVEQPRLDKSATVLQEKAAGLKKQTFTTLAQSAIMIFLEYSILTMYGGPVMDNDNISC